MDESEESYLGTLCEVESRTEHRRTYEIYSPKITSTFETNQERRSRPDATQPRRKHPIKRQTNFAGKILFLETCVLLQGNSVKVPLYRHPAIGVDGGIGARSENRPPRHANFRDHIQPLQIICRFQPRRWQIGKLLAGG